MTIRHHSERGFSLIEVLIATAIMVTVTGAVFSLINPASGMFQAQPEVVDMQQRLRIGVDTITRDIIMAGAGAYAGAQSGSLNGYFAPVQPEKIGSNALYDDGPGAYTTNEITLFYVPSTSSQTSLSVAMANVASPLTVNSETGCPLATPPDPLCGFGVGMSLLLYDTTGAYDTMTVTSIGSGVATIAHNQQGDLSKAFGIGTKVVQVQQHSYFMDTVNRQLMHYDGFNAPVPVLDEVVGLTFAYYGDPNPPVLQDGNGLTSQAVTYGPAPPAIGSVNGNWPAGENCTIQMSGGTQQPRLTSLGTGGSLVLLTQAELTDGPWCPDAANSNRFDADLFRIRKVRVTLRLETGNASLRGALLAGTDAMWVRPGTGTGNRLVADQQIMFDVSPRNMNLIR